MKFTLHGDGWLEVTGLPGWDTHRVTVQATMVDGEPRVTSVHLDALDGADRPALSAQRLRALPVQDIAVTALRVGHFRLDRGLGRAMANIARKKSPKHDPRAAATVEQVAEVYRLAKRLGRPPRTEVVDRLHISDRTADRYIKKARERGLLNKEGTE